MRRPHRAAHAASWGLLALAIPALLLTAWLIRQDQSAVRPPERLDAPAAQEGDQ